jgi:hypothetical protein
MFCESESGGEGWKVETERFERYGLKKSLRVLRFAQDDSRKKEQQRQGPVQGLRAELRAKTKSYG